MKRDIKIEVTVWTPGGLNVLLTLDALPQSVQDVFRNVQNHSTMNLETAVAMMSRATGCKCTIRREEQITCDVNYQTEGRDELL